MSNLSPWAAGGAAARPRGQRPARASSGRGRRRRNRGTLGVRPGC